MDFTIPAEDVASYLSELDDFIEKRSSRSSAKRQYPFFRPSPRMGAYRFRSRGLPRHEWEALLGRDAAARRQSRTLSLCVAERIRRQGRHQPRDGDHPRVSRGQGPRAAQRSAKRKFDRRQSSDRADVPRFRHREAEEGIYPENPRRLDAHRVRPHRTESRLRCDLDGNARRTRGRQWHITGAKMWNTGLHVATHDFVFARTSGKDGSATRHHLLHRADEKRGVQNRRIHVDLQHADRPSARLAHRRADSGGC